MRIVDELLSGPRGRRLCLGYLMQTDADVATAVFWLGHELDPHPGTLIRFGVTDGEVVEDPSFREGDVVELIRRVDPAPVSADVLRKAMCESVDSARYWQEPDGTDILAALPGVREALTEIAGRLVAEMPGLTAPAAAAQWTADWRVASDSAPIERNPGAVLATWTKGQLEDERRSARERPADPRANWSGTWWSVPQRLLETRAHPLDALQLVEDALGWEVATLIPVSGAGRILEIGSADEWRELCREFPMEVTASRRHDWFRVTARDGRWLIPDWERVSQRWDAVHLTTLAYLSSATRLIDIDDEYATVIGGWGPDSTIWLTDVAREADQPRQQWNRAPDDTVWEPTGSSAS